MIHKHVKFFKKKICSSKDTQLYMRMVQADFSLLFLSNFYQVT